MIEKNNWIRKIIKRSCGKIVKLSFLPAFRRPRRRGYDLIAIITSRLTLLARRIYINSIRACRESIMIHFFYRVNGLYCHNVKRIYVCIFFLISIFFLSASALAADLNLTMTVDKPSITMQDTINVQVEVRGKVSVARPEMQGFENFDIQYSGTSSSIQIINGSMTSSKIFQYMLVPINPGRFTVGPAVVSSNGRVFRSNSVSIIVSNSKQAAEVKKPKNVSFQAFVTKKSFYIGEQIIYTIRFNSRVPVQNATLSMPDLKNFWKEQMGNVKNMQRIINGQVWDSSELKTAIFPTSSGDFTIESARLKADVVVVANKQDSFFDSPFDSFFYDTEAKVFRSDPINVNVKPLPKEGRPNDFSGLVGSFSIGADIGKTNLEVGDSVTYTVTVKGDGDLRNLASPEIAKNGHFKIYDDEPSINVDNLGDKVTETKVFKKAIVPLKPGKLTIPEYSLSYFDPDSGKYITLSTSPVVLDVKPSSNPEKITISSDNGDGRVKEEFKILGQDLMPIIKSSSSLKSDAISKSARLICIIFILIPFIGFVCAIFIQRHQKKAKSDYGYVRRSRALRRALKKIKGLQNLKGPDFYKEASRILRVYIGDKCSIDGLAITTADIERRLEPLGVGKELCADLISFLGRCDVSLYGGGSDNMEKEERLRTVLKSLIKSFEQEIKK